MTVNIHGSCVTRDAFELCGRSEDVKVYISRNSVFSVVSDPVPLKNEDFDVSPNFLKRMVYYDFNKKIFEIFKNSISDFLIIDLIDERFNLIKLGDCGIVTDSSNFRKSDILRCHTKYSKVPYEIVDPFLSGEEFIEKNIMDYCSDLLKIYSPEQIIIHRAMCAGHYLKKDGAVEKLPPKYFSEAVRINQKLELYYALLKKNLPGARVISIRKECIADESHKWGIAPFHYVDAYYQKFMDIFDEFTKECVRMETKKKVLYQMRHYGYLAQIMIHKKIHHDDCESVLIITHSPGDPHIEFIQNHDNYIPFFDYIILQNDDYFRKIKNAILLKNTILKKFDEVLNQFGGISSFDYVYSAYDVIHTFGIYLYLKGVKHNIFDFNLVTCKPWEEKKLETSIAQLENETHATTADNALVDSIIILNSSTTEGILENVKKYHISNGERIDFIKTKKIIPFYPADYLTELNQRDVEEIKGYFELGEYENSKYTTIVLLNSNFFLKREQIFARYKMMLDPDAQFIYPYLLLLDYTYHKPESELIIKSHPTACGLNKIRANLPHSKYMPGIVPSLFLNLCNLNLNEAIATGSTAVTTAKCSTTTYPRRYFRYFDYLIPYHIVLDICSKCAYSCRVAINAGEGLEESLFNSSVNDSHNFMCFTDLNNYSNTMLAQYSVVSVYVHNDELAEVCKKIPANSILLEVNKVMDDKFSIYDTYTDYIAICSNYDKRISVLNKYTYARHLKFCRYKIICFVIGKYFIDRQNTLCAEIGLLQYSALLGNAYAAYMDSKLSFKDERIDDAIKKMKLAYLNDAAYSVDYANLLIQRKSEDDLIELKSIVETELPFKYSILGTIYEKGIGVNKDWKMAEEFYIKALQTNSLRDPIKLCRSIIVLKDLSKKEILLDILNKKADSGNARAQYYLSKIYYDGVFVSTDLDLSSYWLERAVDFGLNIALKEQEKRKLDANFKNDN